MNQKIIDWVERMRSKYSFEPGRVLDVGSLNVNGSVRHLFSDATEYLGVDFREGPEVDRVMNSHDMFEKLSPFLMETVVCLNMLEHDDRFWITLYNIRQLHRSGGYFFCCIPTFGFPIHDHPGDYWRAGEDAFKDVIFEGYDLLEMETIYTKKDDSGKGINPVICAIGKRK